jgi:hypothetical protein
LRAGEHIRGEIDKEEQKLIEMTDGPVAALDFALKHLQTTAFETFKQISNDVDAAKKAMEEHPALPTSRCSATCFGEASKDLDKFKLGLQRRYASHRPKSGNNPFAPYLAAIREVDLKQDELPKIDKETKALWTRTLRGRQRPRSRKESNRRHAAIAATGA